MAPVDQDDAPCTAGQDDHRTWRINLRLSTDRDHASVMAQAWILSKSLPNYPKHDIIQPKLDDRPSHSDNHRLHPQKLDVCSRKEIGRNAVCKKT